MGPRHIEVSQNQGYHFWGGAYKRDYSLLGSLKDSFM